MAPSAVNYPNWKAPREDGQIVIWPAARELSEETIRNQTSLAASRIRIQNVPLNDLRREARIWIGHDHDQPLIIDGHQTELYHPGVWVKSVLGDALASRVNGRAVHLAVDTDAPKHLSLRWPGGSEPITDDPAINRAHWSGLLDAPSPRHLEELDRAIRAVRFAQQPIVGQFLHSLRRLSLEQVNLSTAMTNALHELDWELGLRHHAILASPLWSSRAYLAFVHHLIANGSHFAAAYNTALADFRREQKIKTPTRPMPDLAAFEDSIELPFWLDELKSGGRTRPSAFAADRGYVLTLKSGDEFVFDPAAEGFDAADHLSAWLRKNEVRFSPRALVLTMFIRLCLADQFIHGIGGGRYDQVTDRIIANYFKIDPPHFCVTTATMYLPEAVGRTRVCVQCVEREGHSLKHAVLGDAKNRYVQRIASAPRRSRERYEAFAQMHRELAGAAVANPRIREWERRVEEARQRDASEAVLFDRELFYAMQPASRLEQMIRRYRDSFA